MQWITAKETPIRQWLTLHKDFEWLSKEEITEIMAAFGGTNNCFMQAQNANQVTNKF